MGSSSTGTSTPAVASDGLQKLRFCQHEDEGKSLATTKTVLPMAGPGTSPCTSRLTT